METTTVPVRRSDSERLSVLAQASQTTVVEVVHTAIDALERQESCVACTRTIKPSMLPAASRGIRATDHYRPSTSLRHGQSAGPHDAPPFLVHERRVSVGVERRLLKQPEIAKVV